MDSVYIILLACCASCYATFDLGTFQHLVLDRLNTLEGRVAEQNDQISAQQKVIAALLNTAFGKQDHKGILDRPSRFLLDDSDGPIAFTAAINPRAVDHIGNNQTIVFETVITDVGGGYDNTTGVFVAPLPGVYMFSCSLTDFMDSIHGTDKLHAEIMQNNKILARVFAHADEHNRDQGSQTIFARVNKGDRIYVRSVDNNDLGLAGELYSSFSGFLMAQL